MIQMEHVSPINGSNDEIFVVDDDPAVRDALTLFFTQAGFRVTTFADGRSVIRATREALPACILLDMYLPDKSGLDILRQLDAGNFAAPILIISGRSDIPTAVAAVKNGAFDFLEKQMDAETIVARVSKTVDDWTGRLQKSDRVTVLPSAFSGCKPLTPREYEVLARIAAGSTNREAAITLGISPPNGRNPSRPHHAQAWRRECRRSRSHCAPLWSKAVIRDAPWLAGPGDSQMRPRVPPAPASA